MAERFAKLGVEMLVEKGAGASAFFGDDLYAKSSRLVDNTRLCAPKLMWSSRYRGQPWKK
jgi:NAD/NADP transhydrogenase alpha subunit